MERTENRALIEEIVRMLEELPAEKLLLLFRMAAAWKRKTIQE